MGEKNLPFSQGEYDRRLKLTQQSMAAKGIDVLFVEDPSNMAWLTGYDGWSFYVHQGVIVLPDGDPIWWGRAMDAFGALRTVWMDDANVTGYNDRYIQSTTCHAMQDLAERLCDLGFANKSIGVELDNYYFSAKAYLTLTAEMPGARFVDATALVNWQRGVKSDEEIAFVRKAGKISERIIDGILERAEPGMAKNELVAGIYSDALLGVDDAWGDYPAIVPLLPSGADASASHLTWDGRELKTGEATFFEISGCYRRYHAPLCRTIFFGKAPQKMLDAAAALRDGIAAGIEAARDGNTAGDVARALKGELAKAGIKRDGRVGYPIGLSYPPDWGERTISLREEDETVLQAGMTFHFMPGLWMDDWGLEITETILIRDDKSAECICDRPRVLTVKD